MIQPDIRAQMRTLVRSRRHALTTLEQTDAALLLLNQLTSHNEFKRAKRLAVYLANDNELDLTPFIRWCWEEGKSVYLPVLHPFCPGNLLFLHYEEDTILVENQYGIPEPKLNVSNLCPIQHLDVLVTPLVAFDQSGARLGMGGGFYDRTLAHWYRNVTLHKKSTLHPIGVAHDCQLVDSIPTESWDIPIPEIITPTQIISGMSSPSV